MTESSLVAFKRSPSAETTLDVFGVDVTFLVENVHTGGRFGVLEYVSKPGHEPPPHWHELEDEVFYIVEGHLEMHCGSQVFQVEAGECIFLPKAKATRLHHPIPAVARNLRDSAIGSRRGVEDPWSPEEWGIATNRGHLRFSHAGSGQSYEGGCAVWRSQPDSGRNSSFHASLPASCFAIGCDASYEWIRTRR